jgi:hypothetical protein
MIKEVIMYTILCDGCGKDVNSGTEYSCWNDTDINEDMAADSGWMKEGDKHYCENCFYYDDEDNLVIKTEKPFNHATI